MVNTSLTISTMTLKGNGPYIPIKYRDYQNGLKKEKDQTIFCL